MLITVPIYVEKRKAGTAWSRHQHFVRPLYYSTHAVRNESLGQAVTELSQRLSKHLEMLGKEPLHAALAAWTFCPPLEESTLSLELQLRHRIARGKFFFVMFRSLGRQIAFSPAVPQVWFEVRARQTLAARAKEVLTRHFREQEKQANGEYELPPDVTLQGSAWIARLDLSVPINQVLKPAEVTFASLFGGGQALSGAFELQHVGRCLNWQYPHELERAIHREREVQELTRLLQDPERRPVILIGPRLSGKTTVVHEFVFRATARRKSHYKNRRNVWSLSPQSLVSGMMYVGQWEQRLLAILKHSVKRDHTLYFDDFLGMYQAGISRESNLNMAQVLRPYIERRECRILIEMTPESFRVFRELDRGLADAFHVIPVPEPTPDGNLSILIDVVRQLELRRGCRFESDVLPVTLDLQRRYARDSAFPGKAARFLERLAVRSGKEAVRREHVLREFQAQSGLAQPFVDSTKKLQRGEILESLQSEIRGQPEALAALADILCIAKARLNDLHRPLGTLLFLGPTGVGKTQCAKALARFLFDDSERVVRFDMNEFVSPGSAASLVGTFAQPDGLLTSAIRQQPFAVLLFDEIEKAYPDVFDLLLQVLGEGRLSDARGRTVDFSNTIIILTSNLGVKASASRLGFTPGSVVERQEYVKAAESFFRPEFFNRLDRIVPFENLAPDDIRSIASRILQELLSRDGLSRRKCILNIDSSVLDRVAERAFSPAFGARALKRGIERQLTEPVAQRLARLPPEGLTVVNLLPGPEGALVDVQTLPQVAAAKTCIAQVQIPAAVDSLQRLQQVVQRLELHIAALRGSAETRSSTLGVADFNYYTLRERLTDLRQRLQRLAEQWTTHRSFPRRYTGPGAPAVRTGEAKMVQRSFSYTAGANTGRMLATALDLHEFLDELAATAQPRRSGEENPLDDLAGDLALLEHLTTTARTDSAPACVLYVLAPDEARANFAQLLAEQYRDAFHDVLGLDAEPMSAGAGEPPPTAWKCLMLTGLGAPLVAAAETGTHLVLPRHGSLVALRVGCVALTGEESPTAAIRNLRGRREKWLQDLVTGSVTPDQDPLRWQPLVRVYDEQRSILDFRTGLIGRWPINPEQLRQFLIGGLTAPVELQAENSPESPNAAESSG